MHRKKEHFNLLSHKHKRSSYFLAIVIGLLILVVATGIMLISSNSKAAPGKAPETLVPEQKVVQAELPVCTPDGTLILCICSAKRRTDISCIFSDEPVKFFEIEIAGGFAEGHLTKDELYCSWDRVATFEQFVPNQDLCGNGEAQDDVCQKAARLRSECLLSESEKNAIDVKLNACVQQGKKRCNNQGYQSEIYFLTDAMAGST